MQDNSKLIIFCIALLVLILGVLFYEIKEVPDITWKESFDYEDKEPQGLYVFKEVVDRYFNDIDIEVKPIYEDNSTQNGLYIYGGNSLGASSIDTILSIVNRNNDVFIFSNAFFPIKNELENQISQKYQFAKQVNFQFIDDSLYMDSTLQYKFVNQHLKFGVGKAYFLLSEEADLGIPFDFEEIQINDLFTVKEDDDYSYEQNEEKKLKNFASQKITIANDSLILMMKFQADQGGSIYFHLLPELFFNHSYRQPQIFEYTTKVLSHFTPEHIVFVNKLAPSDTMNSKHPLQFIMSSPPLKAAYYLLMVSMLLYAIFGGKRRQKAIPIIDKNENTSLEYIETVSQLFYQQNQHEKLVAHMKNVFYHKMEQKFFIKKDHPNYLESLAKKSKVPSIELQYILDRFKNHDDNYRFKTDQLITLNKRLEQIYNFINQS